MTFGGQFSVVSAICVSNKTATKWGKNFLNQEGHSFTDMNDCVCCTYYYYNETHCFCAIGSVFITYQQVVLQSQSEVCWDRNMVLSLSPHTLRGQKVTGSQSQSSMMNVPTSSPPWQIQNMPVRVQNKRRKKKDYRGCAAVGWGRYMRRKRIKFI